MELRRKVLLGATVLIVASVSLFFILGFAGFFSISPMNQRLDELEELGYRTVSDDWVEYRYYLPEGEGEGAYLDAETWGNFLWMVEKGYAIWDLEGVGYSFTVFYDGDVGVIWFEIIRSLTEGTSSEGQVVVGYFMILED